MMYDKLTRTIKYLLQMCDTHELVPSQNNNNHNRIEVAFNDTDEDNPNPIIQSELKVNTEEYILNDLLVEGYGQWIRQFNIRSFTSDAFKPTRFDFVVYIGQDDEHYKYEITQNDHNNTKLVCKLEEDSLVPDESYYLRIMIPTSSRILKNIVLKMNVFFIDIAPNYPTVELSFYATGLLWKDTVSRVRMTSEAIGQVIKYSLSCNFSENIYSLLGVDNREAAVEMLFTKLSQCVE